MEMVLFHHGVLCYTHEEMLRQARGDRKRSKGETAMDDFYYEDLVKKEKTPKDTLIKGGLIFLTVLFGAAALLIHPLAFIGFVGMIIADYFIIPKTDQEFEYLFVGGDIDIDVIYSKQKRKRVMNVSLSEADLCAPLKSSRMDYYNGNQKIKTLDFSSGNESHNRFAIITRKDGETVRILIEPDEKLQQYMRNAAPNKVFLV